MKHLNLFEVGLLLCLFCFTSCYRSEDKRFGKSQVIVVASQYLEKPDGSIVLYYKFPDELTWRLIDAGKIDIKTQRDYEYTLLVSPILGADTYHVTLVLDRVCKQSENIPKLSFSLDSLASVSDEIAFADRLDEAEIIAPDIFKVDSLYIVDGDIVIDADQLADYIDVKSGYMKSTFYWSDNTVNYTYAPGFTQANTVLTAISILESQTNLSFVYGTDDKGYIEFNDGSSTYSTATGKTGGKQQIYLKPSCSYGSTIHEICHALGFIHEHRRPDRNAYIEVFDNNIIESKIPQFSIMSTSEAACVGGFDYASIMMYSSMAFSKNGNPTMLTTSGAFIISQRDSLSAGDLAGIASIYGPPYHKLESNRTITRDEVSGIYEYYEYYDTYTISFYSNSDFTNHTMITTARPVTVYLENYYYDDRLGRFLTETSVYNVTIPAGCYSYNIANVYSCQNYVMSNISDYSIKTLTLY